MCFASLHVLPGQRCQLELLRLQQEKHATSAKHLGNWDWSVFKCLDTNVVFQTAIFLILIVRKNKRSSGIAGKSSDCLSRNCLYRNCKSGGVRAELGINFVKRYLGDLGPEYKTFYNIRSTDYSSFVMYTCFAHHCDFCESSDCDCSSANPISKYNCILLFFAWINLTLL